MGVRFIDKRKDREFAYDKLYISNEDIDNISEKHGVLAGGLVGFAGLFTNKALAFGEWVALPIKLGIWGGKAIQKAIKKKNKIVSLSEYYSHIDQTKQQLKNKGVDISDVEFETYEQYRQNPYDLNQ